jgi:hypothetical protein
MTDTDGMVIDGVQSTEYETVTDSLISLAVFEVAELIIFVTSTLKL